MNNRSQFFYCYDIDLMNYLQENGERYITKAIHPVTMKLFFLYQKNSSFQKLLNNFKVKNDTYKKISI